MAGGLASRTGAAYRRNSSARRRPAYSMGPLVPRQVEMTADIKIFWGEPPAERSEAEFLAQLREDLTRRGISAVILANYFTASSSRQVDFFIITETHACHVELKRYPPLL